MSYLVNVLQRLSQSVVVLDHMLAQALSLFFFCESLVRNIAHCVHHISWCVRIVAMM